MEEGRIPRKALEGKFGEKNNGLQTTGTMGGDGQGGCKETIEMSLRWPKSHRKNKIYSQFTRINICLIYTDI